MKHWLLILALSATVLLAGLGSSRLWDDDEPRNAGCAREMLARWDWIVPWFNDELRAHKPVLTYWCIMASYVALGESEFSARLPSALAAIGTTLLTYAIGRRLFSRQAALWAALILPTTMLFAMAGRIATPDSLLIFCVTLAMAAFVWTAWPDEPRTSRAGQDRLGGRRPAGIDDRSRWVGACRGKLDPPYGFWQAAAIYAAMGLAVLAKGPVGLVLPTAILGMFLLVVRWESGMAWHHSIPHFFRTAWSMRPLTALAVVALVAGPWYAAVGYLTDGQFLEEFFVTHNVRRATGAMEGHGGGIWFYPAMLLAGFFPWSVFAIPVALDTFAALKQPGRERTAQTFLLCWIGIWLGAFTLARTKLPSYATPCFPAVALLTGHFVDRLLTGKSAVGRYWPAVSFSALALAGMGTCIAIPAVAQRYLPGDQWLAILGIAPLAGGIAGLVLWRQSRLPAAMIGLTVSAAALVLGVFGLGAHVASGHVQGQRLLAAAAEAAQSPELGSYKVLEPSWVYYGRRPIRELHGRPSEAADFLSANPNRLLITTERRWQAIRRASGDDLTVLARADHFLHDQQLVLVGRAPVELARVPEP